MIVEQLELVDFRNYTNASFALTSGVTAIVGRNAQGKTNVAEAMAFLATLDSFRQVPPVALVREGAEFATIRAVVRHNDGRELQVEVQIQRQGRTIVQVNKQRLPRTRDLLGVLRVTVFSPDDLELVKGSPSERRRFVDETLVSLALRNDALRLELDRVLKQRNTLLRQSNGRLTEEIGFTLDVWDEKLAAVGNEIGHERATVLAQLQPLVQQAYQHLAGYPMAVTLQYEPAWRRTGLGMALAQAAELKVDATPMEGFDAAKYDEILGLAEKGLRSVAILPLGYRDEAGDWLVNLKKVRQATDDFVIEFK